MNYPEPIWLDETTSTNSYLAELCDTQTCPELTSVYTAYQSAGRGQRGNSWESEAGANLLFSFVVYPEFLEARRQFLLSQITALALQEILSLYTEDIRIKWPNDIYWKDKKLCGTLIENDLTGTHIGRSISGTGVNLNQEQFISDAPNPVSLFQITGKRYDRRVILEQFMERAEAYYGCQIALSVNKDSFAFPGAIHDDIIADMFSKAGHRDCSRLACNRFGNNRIRCVDQTDSSSDEVQSRIGKLGISV
jgi:BirA family transcriptional regulator, biotin operon repressor / biotin---[acetyl-CoA-carboxylase] ligase